MKRLGPLRPIETTWEDWLLGGGVRTAFEKPDQPLEVEIGTGDDPFLAEQAAEHPEVNWLGIEYSRKRIRRYVRRLERETGQPGNLRLIWRPAGDLLTPFLADAGVSRFHVYFPDPWPKAHHARYRLITEESLAALGAALEPGGEIRLATDAEPYAAEMLAALEGVPSLRSALPAPGYELRPEDERSTVFERRWRALGRRIFALRFVRTD